WLWAFRRDVPCTLGMRRSGARRANSHVRACQRRGPPVTHPERGSAGSGRTESPMDAIAKPGIVQPFPKGSSPTTLSDHVRAAPRPVADRPSREQAEAAVRTLIAYIGDNPDREGLLDTPKRVVGAYEELYRGYGECPAETLERTFSETGQYDDLVLVRDIT